VFYDLTSGERLGSTVGGTNASGVEASKRMKRRAEKAIQSGHEIISVHNHPGSFIPSAADFRALQSSNASYGVVVAHDGSIYRYSIVGDPDPMYNWRNKNFDDDWADFFKQRLMRGGEESALRALEQLGGVRLSILLDYKSKSKELMREDDNFAVARLFDSYSPEEQHELSNELFFYESLWPKFESRDDALKEADRIIDAGLMPTSVTLPDGAYDLT
jgi:hypothetical protein